MELQEEGNQEGYQAVEDVTQLNQKTPEEQLLITLCLCQVESIDLPLYAHHKVIHHGNSNKVSGDKDVDE